MNCREHEFDCLVCDLSLQGAKIRLDLPLAPKSEILLNILEVGSVAAKVAWADEDKIGLEFIAPAANMTRLLGERAVSLGLA